MTIANPIWLVAGAVACIALVALMRWAGVKRSEALRRFTAGHLLARLTANVSPARRRTKAILLVAATACLFTGLARPQWGTHWEEVSRRGIDILIAVDTSKSMLAPDLAPDRLSRAKLGIYDFVEKLEGDRVGLLPFAGSSFLLCPMTLDYGAFLESLGAIDTGIIPEGGTDIAAALRAAEKAFERGSNHKILVLMTDGEDLEGEALEAAKAAAEKGVTIHTVGVGTPNGELIPLGGSSFVKDENGEVVKSRLDEAMLRTIAEETGGVYAPLGSRAEGLETIYREKLALVPKEELSQRMKEVKIDRFEWPLALGILLLLVEFCLGTARREKRTRWAGVVKQRTATAAAAVMLAFGLMVGAANADEPASDPKALYNGGTDFYGNAAWDEAEQAFRSALDSDDVKLQTDAYYNLGNTLYRQGEAQLASGETEAVKERWEQAIKTYENALALNPEDENAQFNKELVEKKLEELKQQEQEQESDESEENEDSSDQESGEGESESEKEESQPEDPSESESGDGENEEEESSDQDSGGAENEENEPQSESESGEGGEEEQDEEASEGEESEPEEEESGNAGEEQASEEESPDEASSGEQPAEGSPDEKESDSASQQSGEGMQPADQVASSEAAPRTPGEMSEEEAMQLLDSLTDEEGKFQAPAQLRGRARPGSLRAKRDW